MLPWAHPNPQPKRHLESFSHFCTAHGRGPYTLQWVTHSRQNCPFPWGSGPHLTHDSLGSPKSTTQTVSRSVQPLQTDRQRQTDWPTNHPTRSVTIGRTYVRTTAMRPNNYFAGMFSPSSVVDLKMMFSLMRLISSLHIQ